MPCADGRRDSGASGISCVFPGSGGCPPPRSRQDGNVSQPAAIMSPGLAAGPCGESESVFQGYVFDEAIPH